MKLYTLYFCKDNISSLEKNNKNNKNEKKIKSNLKDSFYYFISELKNKNKRSNNIKNNIK